MPLYVFKAEDGEEIEHLCSYENRPKVIIKDGKEFHHSLVASAPARTALGWATFAWGVNGRYDHNIKKKVNSVAEFESEYKSAGLSTIAPSDADILIDKAFETKITTQKKAAETAAKLREVSQIETIAGQNKKYQELFGEQEKQYVLEKGKTIYETNPELYDGSIRPKQKYS